MLARDCCHWILERPMISNGWYSNICLPSMEVQWDDCIYALTEILSQARHFPTRVPFLSCKDFQASVSLDGTVL